MYRKTYAAIDEKVLTDNVSELKRAYPSYSVYFGVVKGNAYGHGLKTVNALMRGGVNYFAVATLEEAEKLRLYNTAVPILCLEPIPVECVEYAVGIGVTLTVHRPDYAEELLKCAPSGTLVHLKLDTGMNRLGFKNADDVNNVFELYKKSENITVEGIYTHLATGGLNDCRYDLQVEKFRELTSKISLSDIPIVHIDRSTTLVHHKKPDFVNGVRLGICMYGFAQSVAKPTGLRALKRKLALAGKKISEPIFSNTLALGTAMVLYSEIIDVKHIKKGETVGYGASFVAKSDMTVATAAIGYYDGVSAELREVSVNGVRCPIIGEVCMDMLQLSVPQSVRIGDKVEIFGENISIREAARRSGKSAYRLLTGVSARVPRLSAGKEYYI